MVEHLKQSLTGQLEASLAMLNECIEKCPPEHWDGPAMIAKYPFWMVAYHTLCYVDVYLSPSDEAWRPREGLHPAGRTELETEYPSRRFERAELLGYVSICRDLIHSALAAETVESLAGPSGFPWLKISRLEVHLYNLRHVQHHTGQLTAFLRRGGAGVETGWVKSGWR